MNLSQSSKKKRNKRNISRLKIVLGAMSGKMIQNEAKIFFVPVYLFIECRVVSGVGRA